MHKAALSLPALALGLAIAASRAAADTLTVSSTSPVTSGLVFDTAPAPTLASTPSAITADKTSLATITVTSGATILTTTKTKSAAGHASVSSGAAQPTSGTNSTSNSTLIVPGQGAGSRLPASLSAAFLGVVVGILMG